MNTPQDENLRTEFNEWARAGRGERMERGHRPVGEQALVALAITQGARVLDVGCGSGWATRILAASAPNVEAVGIDVSDEMIKVAEDSSREFKNTKFYVGSAERLPFDSQSFDAAFSMESLYYYANPLGALGEICRVLKHGSKLSIVVDLFKENEPTEFWVDKLAVPVHFLSREEYKKLFQSAGFTSVEYSYLLDPSPIEDEVKSEWFVSTEAYRRYREIGSLMIMGLAKHV